MSLMNAGYRKNLSSHNFTVFILLLACLILFILYGWHLQVECPKYPGFCITRQKKEYPFIEVFHSPEQVRGKFFSMPIEVDSVVCTNHDAKILYLNNIILLSYLWV